MQITRMNFVEEYGTEQRPPHVISCLYEATRAITYSLSFRFCNCPNLKIFVRVIVAYLV